MTLQPRKTPGSFGRYRILVLNNFEAKALVNAEQLSSATAAKLMQIH
jgi:predicted DNA-binding protein (UPF0251 family)